MTRAVQDALRETAHSCCFPESSSNGGGSQRLEWCLFWDLVPWKGTEHFVWEPLFVWTQLSHGREVTDLVMCAPGEGIHQKATHSQKTSLSDSEGHEQEVNGNVCLISRNGEGE